MSLLSRRRLLMSGVGLLGAGVLGGCATNPSTGQPELSPTVVDAIQNAVATAAQYIPAVESIAATAAALFGPGYATIVQIGSSALNTLIAALESVVSNLTTNAKLALKSKLGATAPGIPVSIGTIRVTGPSGPQTITVTGTRVA
jgi:hypothetical protein